VTSQAMPVARAGASAIPVRVKPLTQVRFAFIENLRILLVVLVILHHLAVTYGGEGSWYYYEGQADTITAMVLTLFVVVNQAFFMAFYFAIAAYFVPRSLERKGSKRFLKERFLRLGVPLAFQLLVMGPLLNYGLAVNVWGFDGSLWTYIGDYARHYQGLDTGPLWFVEALLIFSIVYALWWRVAQPPAHKVRSKGVAPGNMAIAMYALAVGLITFIVRIWLPVGWWFLPLNFQFPHFPQYISLFILGTIAYRRGWLSAISEDAARGRLWGWVVTFLIALAPVLFVAGGALNGGTAPFRGGIHWQALTYALWEQFVCVGMVISLLVWFRKRHDHQGGLARAMAASAYAVYVCHAPILVFVSLGLRSIELYPLLKFALASLISIPICFLVGGLVKRLPITARIL
jgi:glucan biosynthesis protein C